MKGWTKYWLILLIGLCLTFWWMFPLAIAFTVIGWFLREEADTYIRLIKKMLAEGKKNEETS